MVQNHAWVGDKLGQYDTETVGVAGLWPILAGVIGSTLISQGQQKKILPPILGHAILSTATVPGTLPKNASLPYTRITEIRQHQRSTTHTRHYP